MEFKEWVEKNDGTGQKKCSAVVKLKSHLINMHISAMEWPDFNTDILERLINTSSTSFLEEQLYIIDGQIYQTTNKIKAVKRLKDWVGNNFPEVCKVCEEIPEHCECEKCDSCDMLTQECKCEKCANCGELTGDCTCDDDDDDDDEDDEDEDEETCSSCGFPSDACQCEDEE